MKEETKKDLDQAKEELNLLFKVANDEITIDQMRQELRERDGK